MAQYCVLLATFFVGIEGGDPGQGETRDDATLEEFFAAEGPGWDFDPRLDGYLRLEFATMTRRRFFFVRTPSDPGHAANPHVGRSDGFALGAARLNVRAEYADLYVRLGFDGSLVRYESVNSPRGTLSTGLKDAYLRYHAHDLLVFYAGRFKPPYDIEQLTPYRDSLFVHSALESRGVRRHEGFYGDSEGFATGRQIGIMAGSQDVLGSGPLTLGYAFAITNGNPGDVSLNDNDLPALFLRLAFGWGDGETRSDEEGPATHDASATKLLVGLSGFYNPATFGEAPNRLDERVFGAGLDASARLFVFTLAGQFLWNTTQHLSHRGTRREHSLGGHFELGVDVLETGLTPAFRFAYYDPRRISGAESADPSGYDTVMHFTFGLRYKIPTLPLGAWLEYTRSVEEPGRAIPNDRVELALQVDFQ